MAAHLTHLTLNRFTSHQIESMVTRVAGGKALPSEVMQQVIARSDGVPLFIEEVTKAVLESGVMREVNGHYEFVESLSPLAIPATLHDSLMARLDRLASAKGVAQLAATIGRQFSYEVLQALSQLDAATLQRELGELVEAEILYQRGLPPQAMYTFKHALIQDTAYQALLKSTRQQYHQRIAEVLIAQFPETVEMQPELLAHHYPEAGLLVDAVRYWQRAGQRAVGRFAHAEAVGHFTQGLAVLANLPETSARDQQELQLQVALGAPLIATKGYGAPEVEATYTRARALCHHLGDTPELFRAMRGLSAFYFQRAKFAETMDIGRQLLERVRQTHNDARLIEVHGSLGASLFVQGEFEQAWGHLEQGIMHYNPAQHHSPRVLQDARGSMPELWRLDSVVPRIPRSGFVSE